MANSKSRRSRNRYVWAPEILEQRRVLTTLAGYVFEDADNDATRDTADPHLGGAVVYLDANNNGILDQSGYGFDPDEFAPGQVLNNARQTVFASGTGTDNQPAFRVLAVDDASRATTGQRVFGLENTTDWGSDRRLRFDFTVPVDSVSLDVVGSSGVSNPNVRLDAYDIDGQLIDSKALNSLGNGVIQKLEIARSEKDISYAIAQVTTVVGTVKYDNLRADDAGSERATVTSDIGFYRFANVDPGLAVVAQQPLEGYDLTFPAEPYRVNVTAGAVRSNLDFGNRTASIGGIVFEERGSSEEFEPGTDRTIEGAGVYLDSNRNGTPDANDVSIFPDDFLDDQSLDFVSGFISLSTVDGEGTSANQKVLAATDAVVSPNAKLFTHEGDAAWTTDHRLRVGFSALANSVQLEFIGGAAAGTELGNLVAYSATGEVIASVETDPLGQGDSHVVQIERDSYDIKYAVAFTSSPIEGSTGSMRLTNLRSNMVKEPVAITNLFGEYVFKPLSRGSYQVRALPSSKLEPSYPEGMVQQVSVSIGDAFEEVDFGFRPDNLPPEAKNDFVMTLEDTAVPVGVLVNDSDPDGELDVNSVAITQSPQNGIAEVDGSGFINYTPNPDFHGRDTLLYTVQDDEGAISNTAIVTIQVDSVNDAPVAVDDVASVLGLNPTSFDVLRNDSDVDGQLVPSTVAITTNPTSGIATVDPVTGVITYTPQVTAVSDSLTYTVEDNEGAVSNEATVVITRLITGTPPVAVDDATTTLEGTAKQLVVTSNDTDADGTIVANSVFVVAPPANGTVSVGSDGSVTYQPALGFIGTDTFSYRVRDNDGLVSNAADVRVSMSERDFPYQNPINNMDVDGDGNVSPRDVLFIIDEIDDRDVSRSDTGEITTNPTPGTRPAGYFDVDGNGFIIGRDVLAVILHINEAGAAAAAAVANGEPAVSQSPASATASVFALPFDAFDAFNTDDDDEDQEE